MIVQELLFEGGKERRGGARGRLQERAQLGRLRRVEHVAWPGLPDAALVHEDDPVGHGAWRTPSRA